MRRSAALIVAVAAAAVLLAPAVSAQTVEDVQVRDRLVAAQEALLNVYRCRFNIDTEIVMGGCTNGEPARPAAEPGQFTGTPTARDIAARDELVAAQEALLNVYRCRFDIDTEIVPGGCRAEPGPAASGVGYFEEVYIDRQRSTPPSGDDAGRDSRTLRTLMFYPADAESQITAPIENARPATTGSPYPLVLFGHGFGSLPDRYHDLLSAIAADGYVVAAPEFPRTSANNPSSPDPRDTGSQPGDLSFLISAIAERSSDPQWPLAGLVDTSRVAATGHSNGALTALGVSANSCCRDDRIDAVVAMAGPSAYIDGEFDYTNTPPILLVHGTQDAAVLYEVSVGVFNQVSAVKGLLTLNGGDHSSWRSSGHEFFEDVTTTFLDFLAMALDNDDEAAARLAQPRFSPNAELLFAAEPNSGLMIEVEAVEANRSARAETSTGLVDGQTVVVSWSGYLPGKTVNIVQCSQGALRDAQACDYTHAKILYPNPTGEGSVEIVIITGSVGNGVCDATVDDCVIAVNDSGIQDPEATVRIPISFAP